MRPDSGDLVVNASAMVLPELGNADENIRAGKHEIMHNFGAQGKGIGSKILNSKLLQPSLGGTISSEAEAVD